MGRPIAYEYKGFIYKGKSYPIYFDDTDPNQFYLVPPSMEVASDDIGPKISVSLCQSISVPSVKGLANLVPYIPLDLVDAIKREYGSHVKIAPLPVATGGQIMIVGPDWYVRGLAVEKPWLSDETTYQGMSPEQIQKLKEAKVWFEQQHVRVPLTYLLPAGVGYVVEVPNLVGSNIGAEVPISFKVLGADYVKEIKGLLDAPGGAILNGQIVYYYVGTTRPWSLRINADLSKVHQYISENVSVGYFWAKADIYNAVERMRANHIIEVDLWDENDNITTKYKPEKYLDMILEKILAKAFDFYPNMTPEKAQAQAEGQRWWWWNGAYARKSSKVEISEIISVKMTIHGKSEPIPVSTGMFLRVPKYGTCDRAQLVDEAHREILRHLYNDMTEEETVQLAETFVAKFKTKAPQTEQRAERPLKA